MPLYPTTNTPPAYDTSTTGTITVTDSVVTAPAGDGTFRTGTSTAGSYVFLANPGGNSAWSVTITGLTTGTLYFEESDDSTTGIDGNWIAVNGRQTGVVNTNLANNSTTNGLFRGNVAGNKYMRLRSVGTLSGTPTITIRFSPGSGAIFLNAGLPPSSDIIGKVTSTNDATNTAAIAGTATAVVKNAPGRLVSVLVTSVGTVAVPIYDNASAASGTIIGYIPASPTLGTVLVFAAPAALGITVGGATGGSAFTVFYA